MSESTPPVEPSNSSFSIGLAAAEQIDKFLEGQESAEAQRQRQNVLVVARALDVQDMLLVRLEEILGDSKQMIEQERPPHVSGLSWDSIQLGSLMYVIAFATMFLRSVALWLMWGWFLVPLGAPALSLGLAIGLVLILVAVGRGSGPATKKFSESRRRSTSPTFMKRLIGELASVLVWQGVVFGAAYLLHLAIT